MAYDPARDTNAVEEGARLAGDLGKPGDPGMKVKVAVAREFFAAFWKWLKEKRG